MIMEFQATKAELAAGLAWAITGLPLRPAVPVLAGVRVEAALGMVRVSGFDYDTTALARVNGDVRACGTVLARGKELHAAVKGLPGGKDATVTAESTDSALVLHCGGATASVELLPAADYPALPSMPEQVGTVDLAAFTAAAKRVLPAVCRDDTLPVLCAMHIEFGAGTLTLAGTDRYRLAVADVPWQPARDDAPDMALNLPRDAVAAFVKSAPKTGTVTVHVGDMGDADYPRVGLSDGVRDLNMRTAVDKPDGAKIGQFPRYGALLPKPDSLQAFATVDAKALADVVKRAGKRCVRTEVRAGKRRVRIDPVFLRFTRTAVEVTTYRDGVLSGSESVPCTLEPPARKGYRVIGWRCAYNPAYLADALTMIGGTARLAWKGPNESAPLLVTPDGDDSARVFLVGIKTVQPRKVKPATPPTPDGEPATTPAATARPKPAATAEPDAAAVARDRADAAEAEQRKADRRSIRQWQRNRPARAAS
jgi:DNA polymerase-3 subunit beta